MNSDADAGTYVIQVNWPQWVAWRRTRLDLTKQGLTQVLGALGFDTTRQTIWRIETEKVRTNATTRAAIEHALDVCEAAQVRALEEAVA